MPGLPARLPAHVDVVLALVFALVIQAEMWLYDGRPQGVVAVTTVAALAFAGTLLVRSTRPELMAGAAAVVVVTQAMLGGRLTSTLGVAFASMLISFSIGLLLSRNRSIAWAGAVLAATWFDLVAVTHDDAGVLSDIAFTTVVAVGAPFLAGRALRDRRERTDELERLNRELQAEREQTARLAVLDERARIAREMHDVVAHSVSLMVVQAGAARHLLTQDPEQSRVALASLETVGREALHELRRALGILRDGSDDAVQLAPQPGLDQLSSLVDRARASGLEVDLVTQGDPRSLTAGVDVAAYRIVQEALTNVIKHAGDNRVRIHLSWGQEGIRLEVADRGIGTAAGPAPQGHGLVGMRERTSLHGGTFAAGQGGDGGFVVTAELPYDSEQVGT